MGQSTLQTTYTEIKAEIGRFLGWDRDSDNWSADTLLDLAAILKRGLRQFYFPQRTADQRSAHRWSFLKPQAELVIWDDVVAADEITVSTATYADPVTTITASEAVFYPSMEEKSMVLNGTSYVIDEYVSTTVVKVTGDASGETGETILIDSGDLFTLPWDFGGMAGDGKFAYDNAENKVCNIDITSDVRIRSLRSADVSTGTPYLAAIVPLSTGGAQAQRYAAMFHHPPNDVLTLHYRYYLLADALVDTTLEYPYGSVQHSETILESCLAIAEVREKDSSSMVHQDLFAKALQASIDHDQKYGEGTQVFGYNGDGSDDIDDDSIRRPLSQTVGTYNGVSYA